MSAVIIEYMLSNPPQSCTRAPLSVARAPQPRWSGDPAGSVGLLAPGEPEAVGHRRPAGTSPVLLVCDHAGRRIPRRLGDLGVPADELRRHSAVDLGALAVSRHLSRLLDAELIYQRYSRLVIDCNRPPHVAQAFVTRTDRVPVPGNEEMSASDAARRVAEIFAPYHARIDHALEQRGRAGRATVLLCMHSYTPNHASDPAPRPWPVCLLFNRDRTLADALLGELRRDPSLEVGINQPYSVDDHGDYAVPVHGERRGVPHVTFELRQDLLLCANDQRAWAERLAGCISRAVAAIGCAPREEKRERADSGAIRT